MISKTFHFWLLLLSALFISYHLISVAFRLLQVYFFGLFLIVLVPVVYALLKYLLAVGSAPGRPEKLKSRN